MPSSMHVALLLCALPALAACGGVSAVEEDFVVDEIGLLQVGAASVARKDREATARSSVVEEFRSAEHLEELEESDGVLVNRATGKSQWRGLGKRFGTKPKVYTFGQSGVTRGPMRSEYTQSGCIPGIRTWNTRMSLGWFQGKYWKTDPVPTSSGYSQPWMSTMAVRDDDPKHFTGPNWCTKSKSDFMAPKKVAVWSLQNGTQNPLLHLQTNYLEGMNSEEIPVVPRNAILFALLVYSHKVRTVEISLARMGWRMAGFAAKDSPAMDACLNKQDTEPDEKEANECLLDMHVNTDIMYLFQQPETLNCMIAFKGTDSPLEAVQDVKNDKDKHFCGYTGHGGYIEDLLDITGSRSYQMRIKNRIQHCNNVYVTGHGLGGTAATLFAGCQHQYLDKGDRGWYEWNQMLYSLADKPSELCDMDPEYGESQEGCKSGKSWTSMPL